jgi:ATP-dependent DNA ligase
MKPQLAKALEIEKLHKYTTLPASYCMEPKLDGVRCVVIKEGSVVKMLSRSGKTDFAPKVPHLVRQLIEKHPWDRFIVDGELGYPTLSRDNWHSWTKWHEYPLLDFNATMRVLGSDDDVAIQKQLGDGFSAYDPPIGFIAFDILMDETGRNIFKDPDYRRRTQLLAWDAAFLDGYRTIGPVRRFDSFDEAYYDRYVELGGEGVMLKNLDADYEPGERHANRWYKLKKFDTIDVVIMDYIEGLGKYAGQIGAVIGGQFKVGEHPHGGVVGKLVPVVQFSGMTDQLRQDMTTNWGTYRGQVVEVKHFGKVGADLNGYRHPQFLRFRTDKQARECII